MSHKYCAYPEYKNTDIEWIGRFPSNWTITRVKFESYVKARVGWHGLKSDDFTEEGPYLVTGSDFKGPEIDWDECYHCDTERYDQDPYIQLREGDLLITKDGTIGKVALVKNLNGKATLNSGVFVVRPLAENYTSRFYFWLLQSSVFTGFVDFNKTGSTIVHLYQDTFVNFKYAMPSFNEQLVIANFLNHETAKIDTLIEKQQQLIKLLKEKRQAVISHAVTKGLNPNVPMRDSGVEWLGEVPAHWGMLKGTYIGRLFGSESVSDSDISDSGDIPFIKVSTLSLNGFQLGNSEFYLSSQLGKSYATKSKYVVFPKRGAAIFTNKVNIVSVESVIDPNLMGWEIGEKARAEFVAHLLKLRGLKDIADVSTVPQINNKHIEPIKFPIPSLEEQDEIIQYVRVKLERFDQLTDTVELAIELSKERRAALISAAVTGKIDVRNWKAPEQSSTNQEAVA